MKRGDIILYKASPNVWYEQLIARVTHGIKLASQAGLWYNMFIKTFGFSSASNTLKPELHLYERQASGHSILFLSALQADLPCFPLFISQRKAIMPIPKDPEKAAEWRRKQSESHKGKVPPNKGKCYTPEDRIIKRFWDKVDTSGDCWVWTAYVFKQTGYGSFGRRHGETVCAHRMSWELTYGSIPDGLYVCHHCDNPPCVRPDHLFLGTNSDNQKDSASKGRKRMPPPPRKLTELQAQEIRHLAAQGMAKTHLAKRYHVGATTIQRIVTGVTYRQDESIEKVREHETR